jgi:ABC-type polysaccharide/polyol phosphate export permease
MVVAMGVIFSRIFDQETRTYMPYLMTGLVIWQFIQNSITEGCNTFLSVASVLQQVPMPFSIHAYRTVYRNLLVLGHNSVIVPIGILIFGVPIDWHIILVVPALFLLAINGVWAGLLLGAVSARFRDIPPIIANFLQVVFFVTPIFWPANRLGRWETLAELNPVFAAIDITRAPLLGLAPAPFSWIVMSAFTVVGCTISFLFFARFRHRIAYWI